MLTVDGNRVVGTSSGEGALTVIEQWDPDLALVASDLPGASGVEVARRLRERNPDLLVILMSDEVPGPVARERSTGVSNCIMEKISTVTPNTVTGNCIKRRMI